MGQSFPKPLLPISALRANGAVFDCVAGGIHFSVPSIAGPHLSAGDQVAATVNQGRATEFLAVRSRPGPQPRHVYFGRVGSISTPKTDSRGQVFVRADVADSSLGLRHLVIANEAVRDYFYFPARQRDRTLYDLLHTSSQASLTDLRLTYRVGKLELESEGNARELREVERAYNLLAHPHIRAAYDALLLDRSMPAPVPYAGSGQIVAAGVLSEDGATLFGRLLLAYNPDRLERAFRARLRRFELFNGYVVYRDTRRKTEVYLDTDALSLAFDPTWNQWRQLVEVKVGISGQFVQCSRCRLIDAEWSASTWYVALPSRLQISVSTETADAVNRARAKYHRLGKFQREIERVRAHVQRQPVSGRDLDGILRDLGIARNIDVVDLCWKPDYERFFFEELKRRSQEWFLFRGEHIFQLPRAIVAEIPQAGHATYIFAPPANIDAWIGRYANVTREEVRKNSGNVAAELGFIGRVPHGNNPRTWLRQLRLRIGECPSDEQPPSDIESSLR